MALLRFDGFSYYDQTIITTKGGKFENWYALDSDSIRVSATYGRNNSSGLRLITNSRTNGDDSSITVHLEENYETMIVGVAVRIRSDDSGDALEVSRAFNKHVISLLDGYLEQVSLVVTPSGRIAVVNGTSGTELGRSESFFLHDNVYYYLEMKATIGNAAGSVEVRADGVTVLTVNPADTQVTGNAFANGVRLGVDDFSDVSSTTFHTARDFEFDDFYIAAVVPATDYNTFLGDVMIDGWRPVDESPTHEWTPSSGTLHYALIDDLSPNTGDYLETSTNDALTLFRMGTLSVPAGSIIAINPNIYATKTEAGVVRIAPVVQWGATAVGDDAYLTQDYRYHHDTVWTKNPVDNQQWPFSLAGSLLFGVRKTG